MTKIGYEEIRKQIRDKVIEPPPNTHGALQNWINGYRACYCDVLDVLKELEKNDPQARD